MKDDYDSSEDETLSSTGSEDITLNGADNMGRKKPRSKTVGKKVWTESEDILLRSLIEKQGTGNWSVIAKSLAGRKGKQCRERWFNHLDPNIKKGEWTAEEDELIVKYQIEYGNKWSKITKLLPGRTDNAVKNRWHSTMRAMGRHNPDSEKRAHSGSVSCTDTEEIEVKEVKCDVPATKRKEGKRVCKRKVYSDSIDESELTIARERGYSATSTDLDDGSTEVECKRKKVRVKRQVSHNLSSFSADIQEQLLQEPVDCEFKRIFDGDSTFIQPSYVEPQSEEEWDEQENELLTSFFHTIEDESSVLSGAKRLPTCNSLNSFSCIEDEEVSSMTAAPLLARGVSDGTCGNHHIFSPSLFASPPLVM